MKCLKCGIEIDGVMVLGGLCEKCLERWEKLKAVYFNEWLGGHICDSLKDRTDEPF